MWQNFKGIEMEVIYLLVGLAIGGFVTWLLCYFIKKSKTVNKTEFDTLNDKFNSLNIDINVEKEKVKSLTENISIKEKSIEKLNDDNNSLNALLASKKTECENLKVQSEELKLEITKTKDDLEGLNKEFQKLSRDFSSSETKLEASTQKNGSLNEYINQLKKELSDKTSEYNESNKKVAELTANYNASLEKLETLKTEIENIHSVSQERFKNIASELLEQKKKAFVEENKKELNTILEPLTLNLNQFKEKIEATRKEDIQDLTSLKKEIESLQKLNSRLSDDARDLTNALKSDVKMQGNWGEDRLNMILEAEGLQKYIDFSREEVHRDDEQDRNRRPDFILKLPNNKHIIIDSKVSLTAYVNYYNAESQNDKNEFLKQHLKSVTDHINNLADKNYQSLLGLNTPDYVFMFMPIESALTLAMNQNSDIFNTALKRKIVLITPTTLIATLKVVRILWQKENQVKNIEKIFSTCGSLYDKFVGFIEDMERIDTGIKSISNSYSNAMNKLSEGKRRGDTIIGKFEAIKNLEAKTNKKIPEKYINEIESYEIESYEIVNLLEPTKNEQD